MANLQQKHPQGFTLLKNRSKKILITLLFLVQTIFANTVYELDAHYGFGASELSFNSVPGIAISIYPLKNFGFSAGLQYSWRWQTKTNYGLNGENRVAIDSEGDSLIFKYSIKKYEEKLSGKILQVPLLFKYSNDLYYAAAGIKIGTVQKASVNINYSGLETEADYFQYNLRLPAPIYQGFGAQKDSSSKTEISSKNLIMLAMEGGVKLKLNNNFALLAGIFADYSFNKGFNRNLKPVIERIENSNGADIVANDRWKSWQPWSIGIAIKLSFTAEHKSTQEEVFVEESVKEHIEEPPEDHNITVTAEIPPPPIPVLLPPEEPPDTVQEQSPSPNLPEFLLNREADFVFYYPESRTSPTDSLHLALISEVANVLKGKRGSQLHCVGYSEKLPSESVPYETALQRVHRIRFTLTRFYSIEEKRIFIYSQGSKNTDYRRAECFVIDAH
jgi:hypothetical protein